ncbi:hypothetical protein BD769DRAFT_1386967 [Suillus cothurnatus]|nr:hypothetical protein BD769DRAFT_1386967 [Suillus cothurnatus]
MNRKADNLGQDGLSQIIPNQHTVTACLVSFAQQNGFVNLQFKDSPHNRDNVLSAGKKYFSPEAKLKLARLTFARGGKPKSEPFNMVIMYNKDLHGSKMCPYLALKLINKEKFISLDRDHYMDIMKSVEFIITKIKLANNDGDVSTLTKQDGK